MQKLQKLGAVIYLSKSAPLSVARFMSDFVKRWPQSTCSRERDKKGETSVRLRIGPSRLAIEVRHTRVPESITTSVAEASLHWPDAKEVLSPHRAHIGVVASVDNGDTLRLAADLTKAIASLLAVTDSLGVCWLSGPVLMPKQDFLRDATELLSLEQAPLMLWVAVRWNPEGHFLHSKGMSQFGAPEIFIARQPSPSKKLAAYLFTLIEEIICSGRLLIAGETIEGPNFRLMIESLQSESAKEGLFLVPCDRTS